MMNTGSSDWLLACGPLLRKLRSKTLMMALMRSACSLWVEVAFLEPVRLLMAQESMIIVTGTVIEVLPIGDKPGLV